MLVAMYGEKGKVSAYKLGEVLTVIGWDMNRSSLQDWTQHHYGKIIEAKRKTAPAPKPRRR